MIHIKSIQQIWKKILDTATKTRLHAPKAASKKVVHKTAEASGELIGIKIAEKTVKQKALHEANSRNAGEIFIRPERKQTILK